MTVKKAEWVPEKVRKGTLYDGNYPIYAEWQYRPYPIYVKISKIPKDIPIKIKGLSVMKSDQFLITVTDTYLVEATVTKTYPEARTAASKFMEQIQQQKR